MKKNLLHKNNWLIISSLFIVQSLFSQSIEELYVKMPDILNPTLSSQNRLELLEYHKAHQSDSTANRFGNQAYLMVMDTLNERIIVKNTPTSTFEMKINYLTDSIPYIGIIKTICAPICQSTIEFYDTAWNVIPLKFEMPKAYEWLNDRDIPADKIDLDWVRKTIGISFVSLNFANENNVIFAKNNSLDFLNEADKKIIRPFVSDSLFKYKLDKLKWTLK